LETVAGIRRDAAHCGGLCTATITRQVLTATPRLGDYAVVLVGFVGTLRPRRVAALRAERLEKLSGACGSHWPQTGTR
jgi:hypothetical protein